MAFLGGVAAWAVTSALYLGALYMSGWSYTGHWPVHYAWLVAISLVAGSSSFLKVYKALEE